MTSPTALVYQPDDGPLAVAYLAGTTTPEDAASIVPDGIAWRVVLAEDLPAESAYRDAWTANFDDQPCVVSVDAEKRAEIDSRIAAEHAVIEFDSWWAEMIGQGFRSQSGVRLGLTTEDVTLLTGNYVLAKEAAALSAPIPPVIDADGVPVQFDIEELTALMLEYGQYRASLSAEYAQRKAAIPTA